VKLRQDGTLDWAKSLGGEGDEVAYSVQETSDEGYVIAGYSGLVLRDGRPGSWTDCWVAKLNNNGELQWEKRFGGSDFDVAYSIRETKDGDYIVAGASRSSDGDVSENYGDYDYWIVKLK
jgi:hypothetical protein